MSKNAFNNKAPPYPFPLSFLSTDRTPINPAHCFFSLFCITEYPMLDDSSLIMQSSIFLVLLSFSQLYFLKSPSLVLKAKTDAARVKTLDSLSPVHIKEGKINKFMSRYIGETFIILYFLFVLIWEVWLIFINLIIIAIYKFVKLKLF